MDCLLTVGNWLLPLLYLALMIDYGATFFLRTRTHHRSPWLVAVVVVHGALLVLRSVQSGHAPVADAQRVLSAVAWAIAAVYAVIELASRDRRTGVFVMSLAFLFQYTASILLAAATGPAPAPVEAAQSVWARLHVIPALVAYAALGFAAIYGLLYLLARRGLKHHRFGVLFDRLPPLDLVGTMMWHSLLTGFAFMTVTMLTGPLLLGAEGPHDVLANPKILSKIIVGGVAWLIYATALVGRLVGRWQPPRISGIAMAGYLLVMALLAASALLP